MIEANLLFLDEIATGFDSKGFERDMLWRILNSRVHKWTLLTSNLMLSQIGELIDVRIASRMVRDGSITVEVNTKDYALR